MADSQFDIPAPSAVPFVGREKERAVLTGALADAKASKGETWLVEGIPGIGKTRLVRWLEQEAVKNGFRVLWGSCLKESNLPFFPFQQIFRRSGPDIAIPTRPAPSKGDDSLPLLTIFEDERPLRLLERAAALSATHPCLVLSRERPSSLRKQLPSLNPKARVLQLAKAAGKEDCIPPGQLDDMGERLSRHLRSSKGAVVVLTGLDYLIGQNGFQPVLKLVQFLREEAKLADAHVMLSVNPASVEEREMATLEGEGEVVREGGTPPATPSSEPVPPAMTMMRYLETLEREAPQQPHMLVLDDLQWADPDSLRTLQFLARNILRLPVLVVCTMRVEDWRPPEEKVEQGLDEILGKMDKEGALMRLPLRGLGGAEVQELAQRTIGVPFRKGDPDRESALLSIFQKAEGNPYFVQEALRQLVQEGALRKEGDQAVLFRSSLEAVVSAVEGPDIPPTLRRLVARRLSLLTEQELDLLRWASVAGSEFDLAPLEGVLHRPRQEVSAVLLRLERDLHIIDPQPGGERWSFAHPLVWEVTLAETLREERRRRALVLADWWAEHRNEDVETVARLYNDAQEPRRGVPWVRKVVDKAISEHAPETVERYHRWLQNLLRISGAGLGARVEEGMSVCERHMLEIGGGPALSHMLKFIANMSETPGDWLPPRILLSYSLIGHDMRGSRAQMEIVTRAMAGEHVKLPLKWDAIRVIANAYVMAKQAKYKPAIAELQRFSSSIGEVKEPWVRGRFAYLMGDWCTRAGLAAEARKALAELRSLTTASGTSLLEVWCISLEGMIAEVQGDLRQCEESNTQAVAITRRRGDIRNTAIVLANLALYTAGRGEFDVARAHLKEDQVICTRFGFKDIADQLSLVEGDILWGEQRWAELVQKLVKTLAETVEVETGRAVAQSFVAEGYVELGNIPFARACINVAEQRKEELEPGEFVNVLRVRARVEEAEGDLRTARKTLEKALQMGGENMDQYWGAWVKAETARWEYKHGDTVLASSFRAEADTLFDKCGVLPAGRPKWLQAIHTPAKES